MRKFTTEAVGNGAHVTMSFTQSFVTLFHFVSIKFALLNSTTSSAVNASYHPLSTRQRHAACDNGPRCYALDFAPLHQ